MIELLKILDYKIKTGSFIRYFLFYVCICFFSLLFFILMLLLSAEDGSVASLASINLAYLFYGGHFILIENVFSIKFCIIYVPLYFFALCYICDFGIYIPRTKKYLIYFRYIWTIYIVANFVYMFYIAINIANYF